MRKTRFAIMLLALIGMGALTPRDAAAQHPQKREGFWFNVGLGYGTLGCQDCTGREGGLSGGLALGGTINSRLLLGAASNAWTKSEDGVTLTVSTLTAAIRFYPSSTGGFFLLGGLGLGRINVGASGGGFSLNASTTGTGALIGLGYDFRIGANVSLTPFWNGFAGNFDNGDANVGQVGLGLTIH